MKPYIRFYFALVLALLTSIPAASAGNAFKANKHTIEKTSKPVKKVSQTMVYAFAVGTSLKDSTVYISSIQTLENATIESKKKFLQDRHIYSQQFKVYLNGQAGQPCTCALFFSTRKAKLEKEVLKLRKLYNRPKTQKLLKEVSEQDFQFISIDKLNL